MPTSCRQARDGQAVAVLVADLGCEAIGRVLGRQRVQPEALGRGVPDAGALEEVEGPDVVGDRLHGLRAEHLDRADGGVDLAVRVLRAVGEAQHRGDQRDVGLDRRDDVGRGDVVLGDHRQQAVAGLGEGGERLECFESQRQPPAVTLVLVALAGLPGAMGGARRRGVRTLGRWHSAYVRALLRGLLGRCRRLHSVCFPFLGFTGRPGRGQSASRSLSATARTEL